MDNTNYCRRYFMIKDDYQEQLWQEYDDYINAIYSKFNHIFSMFPAEQIAGYILLNGKMTALTLNTIPEKSKGYLIEQQENKFIIKPNKKLKAGKLLNEKIVEFNQVLKATPDDLLAFLNSKWAIRHSIRTISNGRSCIAYTLAYTSKNPPGKMIIDIPTDDNDKTFPTIPDCFIALKKSHYYLLMGE